MARTPRAFSSEGTIQRRPDLFRALGPDDPPAIVEIGSKLCRFERTLKHDSWAASALYLAADGTRIACKYSRARPVLLLPFRWVGMMLAAREQAVFEQMNEVDGFPRWAGPVVMNGRSLPHAVAHYWIEGETFTPTARVDDHFFPRLESMISKFHSAGMAYVDMPKWENILIGVDGRPYLIDYQIRFRPSPWLPLHWLLRLLQEADRYYLRRHWHRSRSDQCPRPDPPPMVRFGESIAIVWRAFRTIGLRMFGVKGDPRKRPDPTDDSR